MQAILEIENEIYKRVNFPVDFFKAGDDTLASFQSDKL